MAETDTGEMAGQLAIWTTRGRGAAAQEEPRGPAQVIQLPLWPEPKRGAPNAVLARGAVSPPSTRTGSTCTARS